MEKRDYYYFKEILLGLKNEYFKCDVELQKLKQYAKADSEKIANYYFRLSQWQNDRKPELRCVIEAKKSRIKQLVERIEKKIGTYAYPYDFECRFNNNDETILGDHKLYVLGESSEFCSQAQLILNSEFANGIFLERVTSIDDFNTSVSTNQECIKYSSLQDITSFEYYPLKPNKIWATYITEKGLYDMLNSKYSRENFSAYHQKVIDSSLSTIKPIEIIELPDQINSALYEPMELVELDDKVVLTKKKK